MDKDLKRKLDNSIQLLESVFGKKIMLEANEATRNLGVESLNALSDSLDMVKQNITQAMSVIQNAGNQDTIMTKLRGMTSIIDSALTDVAEGIASLTGMETKEDIMGNEMNESELNEEMEVDEHGVEMTIDDAVKNIDDVKKLADKKVNITLDDKSNNSMFR